MVEVLILIGTFIFMEGFSWFVHKYLFHGPLWFIHKTHHSPRKGWFELNDLFSLGFGGIAVILIIVGLPKFTFQFWIGAGITLYGVVYFIFHDMFIHGRFAKWKSDNKYLMAIRKGHKVHHKQMKKNPSEEFGLLAVGRKYFKKKQ
jgi:beta-carotene 3-hydroxylase